ncbi:MAG: hypothetical protein ABSA21_04820 [Candidatus Limnocylindrales bacterium]
MPGEQGEFIEAGSDLQRYRGHSSGSWICAVCNVEAITEHDRAECHRCSDWGGCGRDCTLSRIVCPKCGRDRAM